MKLILATLLALTLSPPLPAQEVDEGPVIADPVILIASPVARSAAGYMSVTNLGPEDDRLIAVEADGPSAMLHRSVTEGDIARMEALPDGIALPAGETVTLDRGGLHIMFMGMSQPLAPGDTLAATLVFEEAGAVVVSFPVEPLPAAGDADMGAADPASTSDPATEPLPAE